MLSCRVAALRYGLLRSIRPSCLRLASSVPADEAQVAEIMQSIGCQPIQDESLISTDPNDPEIFASDSEQVEEQPAVRLRDHPIVKMAQTDAAFEDSLGGMKNAAVRILSQVPAKPKSKEKENWMENVHHRFLNPCAVYDRDRSFEYLQNDHFMSHAVIRRILREVKKRRPELIAEKVLDFGAGTGAGSWAFAEEFEGIRSITNIEPAPFMRAIGEEQSGDIRLQLPETDVSWLPTLPALNPDSHNIVLASYVIGEVHPSIRSQILHYLWGSTAPGGIVILVEYANTQGSETLLDCREKLLRLDGANVVAPCPHSGKCPWADRYGSLMLTMDKRKLRQRQHERHFCHFGQRVLLDAFPMGSLMKHRPRTKSRLRFQHEHMTPFVYSVIEKNGEKKSEDTWSRMIRAPIKRGGHVILDICQADGTIDRQIVSQKKGAGGPYKLARMSRWADLWPYTKAVDDFDADDDLDEREDAELDRNEQDRS